MSVPTMEQVEAANFAESYKRGWADGAAGKRFRESYEDHPREDLRDAYASGLEDGRIARSHYIGEANKRYGHVPQILRGEKGNG